MVKGKIKENHGNIERFGNILIPFDYRVADVIAAEDHIRQRNIFRLGILYVHIAQIDSCIRANVRGIALTFCVRNERRRTLACTNGSGVVLRIDHSDIHGLQQLLRRNRCGPCHQTSFTFGTLR